MKTIYAIRDRIANDLVGRDMYMLMVFRTTQQAVRYFADAINDETSMLHKHPADYELVALGTLQDDQIIHSDTTQDIIITGDALVAAQEPTLVKGA